jgi:hypothetical protein
MAISAFACAGAPAAYAANFSCQSTGGSWTTAGDWTGCNGTFPDNGGGNTYDATVTSGTSTLSSAVTVGNVTIDSGANWFTSASGSTITLTNALSNSGTTLIDASGGQGGTTVDIGSDLTNSGTFDVGVTNLSAPTNVTVGGTLNNAGGIINLQGNATSGTTNQATLNIQGAMPTTVAGQLNVSGDALLQVTNGITAIGANSQLSVNGAQARVSIGSGTTNSALTSLASNAGNFIMQGNTGLGAGGATVTTTTGFTNTGNVYIDALGGGQGASTFNIGSNLTNSGTFDIGVTNLSAPTNVTVGGTLNNTGGVINLQGNATSGTTNQATLNIQGAMPTTVTGQINVSGDALLQVTNGITGIGANSQLSVNGAQARVSIGSGTTNSALTGLASNAGNFVMQGNTGLGAGGATVTTTTGFTNTGNVYIDAIGGGQGASTFNIGSNLTNSGTFDIGVTNLSAPTNVTVGGTLNNAGGVINLQGNATSGTTDQATLNIQGAMPTTVAGQLNLGGDALLQVTNGITAIGASSQLSLAGAQARVSIGSGTTNSALTGLANNAGTFIMQGDTGLGAGGATVTTTTGFTNTNNVFIDAIGGGQGASTFNIGSNLTNSGTFDIGVTNLSAPTNVTVGGTLNNTGGTINLQGNAASGTTNQATLNIQGAMPTTVAGQLNVSGDALLQVTNGITAIGANSQLSVNGAQARVSIGSGTTNSALTGLASNAGTFIMQGDTGFGAGGATVTTTTGFTNTTNVFIDAIGGGQGASTFNIGSNLTNSGSFNIGVTNLSAPTNVTVGGTLNNTRGVINLQGNATSGTTNQATLSIEGAMPTTVAGQLNLGGDALLPVTNGITAIGSSGQLSLAGAQSRVSIGAGTTNSALTGLASNAGTLLMRGDTGLGAGGATVTTTTGFTNTGSVFIDAIGGGQGASTFNVGGTLTNSGTFNIGISNLSAPTNVTATGLANSGTINMVGSSTANVANLTVNGAAGNSGTANIGDFSVP